MEEHDSVPVAEVEEVEEQETQVSSDQTTTPGTIEKELPCGWINPQGEVVRKVVLKRMNARVRRNITEGMSQRNRRKAFEITEKFLLNCIASIGDMSPVPLSVIQELLIADRDYLLVELYRFQQRSDEILFTEDCPRCGAQNEIYLNADDIEIKRLEDDSPRFEDGPSRFYEIHNHEEGLTLFMRYPSGKDLQALKNVIIKGDVEAASQKVFERTCLAINGKRPQAGWVDELDTYVLDPLVAQTNEAQPGPQLLFNLECVECGQEAPVQLQVDFLYRNQPGQK